MKSFLYGNPELKLALNEDLKVGRSGYGGSVVLDDCNFNDCADVSNFETNKVLKVKPPTGNCFSILYNMQENLFLWITE